MFICNRGWGTTNKLRPLILRLKMVEYVKCLLIVMDYTVTVIVIIKFY